MTKWHGPETGFYSNDLIVRAGFLVVIFIQLRSNKTNSSALLSSGALSLR